MNKFIREFLIVSLRLTKVLELEVFTAVWVCVLHCCTAWLLTALYETLLIISWTHFFSSIPLWNLSICWFEVLLLWGDEETRPRRTQEKHYGKTCMWVSCRFIGSDLYIPSRRCQEANAGNAPQILWITLQFWILGLQLINFISLGSTILAITQCRGYGNNGNSY